MHRPLVLLRGTLVATAAILAACKTEQQKQPAPPPAPPAPHAFTVHGSDFKFAGPDTVPAGVTTITFVNDGPGFHHLQLVMLDSGKTAKDFEDALKKMKPTDPFPAWAKMASGPNAAMPGSQSVATLDLAAGNYAMICLVDVPDRIPHFAKGMIRPLTVTPSTGAMAAMPKADYTLQATEYTFATTDTIKAGHHTFDVKLQGVQPHEVILFKLVPGKTPKDFGAWAQTYKGPPPVTVAGGVTTTMPGSTVQFTSDITPGDYMLVCLVPDLKDGKPHIAHGMMVPFSVK